MMLGAAAWFLIVLAGGRFSIYSPILFLMAWAR